MKLYELFIGFRYLKAKKAQGFISFNTVLSIFTVFLGVFILIVVISVMNGFQAQIKDKILDVDAHVTITDFFNESRGITKYEEVIRKIKSIDGVRTAYPFLQGQALLRHRLDIHPVLIRGVGDQLTIPEDVRKFIVSGSRVFTAGPGVFIGEEMAFNLGVKIGDSIELIVPTGRLSAAEGITPGMGSFKVIGLFKTGYYDFDTRLIIMSLQQAQRLYQVGPIVWGIAVKIHNVLYQMDTMAEKIKKKIGFQYSVMTAEERNKNLFYALRLEKLIMTIILFLVIISAGFTIMGTLAMVVMEKRKSVGILKSMGARPRSIMVIFVLEGFFIGVIGSLAGTILGLATSLNLESIILWIEGAINHTMAWLYAAGGLGMWQDLSLVPSNVYYIDAIPTEINPEFVVFIATFAVILSTVAAIFPAWQASRLNPVETIRYE